MLGIDACERTQEAGKPVMFGHARIFPKSCQPLGCKAALHLYGKPVSPQLMMSLLRE